MKQVMLLTLGALLLVSCGANPPSISQDDLVATAVAQLVASAVATNNEDQLPSNTSLPTDDLQAPTATEPENSAAPQIDNEFALNYLASQDSGGVIVEIARVLVGDKVYVGNEMQNDFDECAAFEDATVVVEIIFKVTNNTGQIISIYPDQGTVVIGNEQVSLTEFMFCGQFGDDFSGDIFPGVTSIGGMWLGIKRSKVDEINKIIISFDAPTNQEYDDLGQDYYFELDISNHIFEEYPAELQ